MTCTKFVGRGLSGFGDIATFKNSQISLSDHGRLKKFMQVGVDVTCMHTNYVRCGLSGFGDKISL